MTVPSSSGRNSYIGNGSVDEYDYTFRILAETDLLVKTRDTNGDEELLELSTDYTVSGVGEAEGGSISLVAGNLASGVVLSIRRVRPISQETDIRNQGEFLPEIHEDAFDKGTMVDQQQQDEIDRSVKLAETVDPEDFDATLPASIVGVANIVPMTNAAGDGFEAGPTADEISSAQGYAEAASDSAVLAEDWASKVDGQVAATDYSSKAWAIGGVGVTDTATRGASKEWATKVTGTVDGTGYSAKEWATGNNTRGAANGGSARDWANYTGGTVDNAEYSAKKYAQDSAASAASAAAAIAAAFFNDVMFFTNADSPLTLTQAHNGKLLVFDTSGGAISVTLPTIASTVMPFNVGFNLKTAGNNLTINRASTDTIAGATSAVLAAAGTGLLLSADTGPSPDEWSLLPFGTVADLSITTAKLAAAVFSGLTAVTAELDDSVAIADASDSGNKKKATVSSIKARKVATATTTLTADATHELILCNANGGAFTITLPTAAGITGKEYFFEKIGTDTNAVTVDGAGSETVGGMLAEKLVFPGSKLHIVSDGTNWVARVVPIVFASYATNAGQTLSTGTLTIIDFEDVDVDTHSAVATGGSWAFTAPRDMPNARVDVAILFGDAGAPDEGEAFSLYVYKNGSLERRLQRFEMQATPSTISVHMLGGVSVPLKKGDTLNIRVTQATSSNMSLSTTNPTDSYVRIVG